MKSFESSFTFPYYCVLVNQKSFYYFENAQTVQEVQIMGKKAFHFERKISILPDRVWMQDVFENTEIYLPINVKQWNEQLKLVTPD
jgi:hypothetical protein